MTEGFKYFYTQWFNFFTEGFKKVDSEKEFNKKERQVVALPPMRFT